MWAEAITIRLDYRWPKVVRGSTSTAERVSELGHKYVAGEHSVALQCLEVIE
jgi:hypothetical protein